MEASGRALKSLQDAETDGGGLEARVNAGRNVPRTKAIPRRSEIELVFPSGQRTRANGKPEVRARRALPWIVDLLGAGGANVQAGVAAIVVGQIAAMRKGSTRFREWVPHIERMDRSLAHEYGGGRATLMIRLVRNGPPSSETSFGAEGPNTPRGFEADLGMAVIPKRTFSKPGVSWRSSQEPG